MSEDSTGKMLRMVRFEAIMQDAERLRTPLEQDAFEALSRTIHLGSAAVAKRALLGWCRRELKALRREPRRTRQQRECLLAMFQEMWSKIEGRMTVMPTELGYYSSNVGPDYSKHSHDYFLWAKRRLLRTLDEGNELVIQGHVGTGKSHLAVLFMEEALRAGFVVVTNISGIQDKTGQYTARLHQVSLLSEILRIWTDLPPDTRILLALDEPEANLKGGNTKGVNNYSTFRYMIRKLGMAKIEIWHTEGEQYKSLREDESDRVYRILKDDRHAFQFTQRVRDEEVTSRIENVPDLAFLGFATRGMGSIDMDVQMRSLLRRIAKLYDINQMKTAIREALEDPRIYLAEYRDEAAVQAQDAAKQEERDQGILASILADAQRFLGKTSNGFDREKVRAAFRLTERDARLLSTLAWEQYTKKAAPKPLPAEEEQLLASLLEQILARKTEFAGHLPGSFSRIKIRAAFGVSHRIARILTERATKAGGDAPAQP